MFCMKDNRVFSVLQYFACAIMSIFFLKKHSEILLESFVLEEKSLRVWRNVGRVTLPRALLLFGPYILSMSLLAQKMTTRMYTPPQYCCSGEYLFPGNCLF